MILGNLYNYDDKKLREAEQNGENVVIGIGAESLLDDINIELWQNGYNAGQVLHNLQAQLLQITGRVEVRSSDGSGAKDTGKQ